MNVSATRLTDLGWVRDQVERSVRVYGRARREVLGTIWWYSLSSVLVGPSIASLVSADETLDPALDAITLDMTSDGRFTEARSSRALLGELGPALGAALGPVIATVAEVSGARERALGAIATDSIGNRLLWTSDVDHAMTLAEPLVAAMGLGMPAPRFLRVGATPVVRRSSCCLIYEANSGKCTSCPRQTPADRALRLRAALG